MFGSIILTAAVGLSVGLWLWVWSASRQSDQRAALGRSIEVSADEAYHREVLRRASEAITPLDRFHIRMETQRMARVGLDPSGTPMLTLPAVAHG